MRQFQSSKSLYGRNCLLVAGVTYGKVKGFSNHFFDLRYGLIFSAICFIFVFFRFIFYDLFPRLFQVIYSDKHILSLRFYFFLYDSIILLLHAKKALLASCFK